MSNSMTKCMGQSMSESYRMSKKSSMSMSNRMSISESMCTSESMYMSNSMSMSMQECTFSFLGQLHRRCCRHRP